jgi:hypothetical protein
MCSQIRDVRSSPKSRERPRRKQNQADEILKEDQRAVATPLCALAECTHHGDAGESQHNQQDTQRNGWLADSRARSMEPFEQMIPHAQRIGDDGQRWIDRSAGGEERTIDDIQVVDVMRPAIGIQNRLLRVRAKAAGPVLMADAFERNPLLEIGAQMEPVIGMAGLLQNIDPLVFAGVRTTPHCWVCNPVGPLPLAIVTRLFGSGRSSVVSHQGTACVVIRSSTKAGVRGGASALHHFVVKGADGWMLPIG